MRYLFTIFAFSCALTIWGQYSNDILGAPFLKREIKLPDDYEGKVIATLVKCLSTEKTSSAILYIHGYNDYFFQKEFALEMCTHSLNFYALDLRKYGRSYLPHQKAFNARSLNEYFIEIDSCIQIIKREGAKNIFIVGHSTGGLISSLYMNQSNRDSAIAGLILNSPFLSMNSSWINENMGIPVITFLASMLPNAMINEPASDVYAVSLLKSEKGEWDYNESWKHRNAPKKSYSWIKAVHRGHKQIKKGLKIQVPVLVMHSDKSSTTNFYTEYSQKSDAVLDHEEIQCLSSKLARNVTIATVPDGLHDLALSRIDVRNYYYNFLKSWIKLNNSI